MVNKIDVDSYPVGLDISNDGRYVIVTSQGRGNQGGNAVNIYEVHYDEHEPVLEKTDGAAVLDQQENSDPSETDQAHQTPVGTMPLNGGDGNLMTYALVGGGILVVAGAMLFRRMRKAS